jgi:hypothetical protein
MRRGRERECKRHILGCFGSFRFFAGWVYRYCMEERMRREALEVFDKHVAGREAVTTTA